MSIVNNYDSKQIFGLYELGRLYYEMGIYPSAEKIFSGLTAIQDQSVPCWVGLGLVKLERGLYEEAEHCFREGLKNKDFEIEAKFGMVFVFFATKEFGRAKVLLNQMEPVFSRPEYSDYLLSKLRESLLSSCA